MEHASLRGVTLSFGAEKFDNLVQMVSFAVLLLCFC